MSSRRRRLTTLLLIIVPLLVLLFAALSYITSQVRRVTSHLDVILVEEVKRQTGREAKVGKVEVSPLGTAYVYDLKIANGESFDKGTLLAAKRVDIHYRWRDMIFGKVTPIQSVDSLRLVEPKILLERFRIGKLNVQDFINPKPGPKRPPFKGTIYMSDGELTFRDWFANVPGPKPTSTTVVKLNGTFDASSAPLSYIYDFYGRGKGGRFDRIAASGSIDNKNKTLSIDIGAKNAAAGYWPHYIFKLAAFDIKQGRADINLSATRRIVNKKSVWSYSGNARMRDGVVSVAVFKEPARNVQGTVRFGGGVFNFDANASMVGTPFKFTGNIVSAKKPGINLHITSQSADFARLLHATTLTASLNQVAIHGKGPLKVDIIGPSDKLAYAIHASVPEVSSFGYTARNVNAKGMYADGVVHVENASGSVLNGHVSVAGTVEPVKGNVRFAVSGSARNVELASIKQLSGANVRGRASGRFILTGTSAAPTFQADVKVPAGKLNNVGYKNAVARISISRDQVSVASLAAGIASGVVRMSGTAGKNKVNLKIAATGADIAQVVKPLGMTGYSGIVNFNGSVVGPISDPVVTGSAELFNGRFDRYSFDYIRGNLVASKDRIALDKAIIRILPAEVALSGSITGLSTGNPSINVKLNVSEAPADKILEILGVHVDVKGTVTGNMAVRGSIDNLYASGTLALTDGSVAGYPVREASADVNYKAGNLTLTGLVARSDGAVFSAEGSINSAGNLNFSFIANDISLSRLAAMTQPYAVLSGTVDMTGKLTGSLGRPNLSASVVSNHPTINTVQFDRFSADVAWNGYSTVASNVLLKNGEGEISLKLAAFDMAKGTLAVEGGTLANFSIPSIYSVVAESPYVQSPEQAGVRRTLGSSQHPQAGVISGAFSASGPLDQLEASVNLSARKITIAGVKDAKVDLVATASKGQILLTQFEAMAGALNVSASGTLISDGQTNLEVDAYNVDLAALAPATGALDVSGTATVRTTITGAITAPLVTASVEMVDPTIYGVRFDRLRASQITIGRDSIDISRALLTRGEQSATFYGVIPWNWSTFGVPTDRPVDLHARMEPQTLDILTIITSAIVPDKSQPGQIYANVDLTGTLSNPNLSGRVAMTNGNISIRNMQSAFTNLQADISFQGDLATVNKLSGQSSLGGSFAALPGGTISLKNLMGAIPGQPRGAINMAVQLNAFQLAEQNLFGYQEHVNGTFNSPESGIRVTGSLIEPLIAGTINISNGTAILSPVVEGKQFAMRKYPVNPKFNLTFALENNVWFRNPSIRALLRGDGTMGGSLARPELTAALKIDSGQLKLPTQSMRITSGTISVSWLPSESNQPELPHIVVDIRAQTSVMATSPTGTRRRYTIVLSVQGPLDNLQPENVNLRSEPSGLTRTQMLAALGHFEDIYGGGELALRQQLSDIFTVAASPLVFNKLENAFIGALGLEEFNIEYGFEQPLSVFASRRVFGNVYVSYWRIVTGSPSITGSTYQFSVNYRLKDWLDAGIAVDSRRVGVLEATYNHRF